MAEIKYVSMDDELDFFVDDDWPVVMRYFTSKHDKRSAVYWIEKYVKGCVVIYNGGVKPRYFEESVSDIVLGDGKTYYFFFEDSDSAAMFKVAN